MSPTTRKHLSRNHTAIQKTLQQILSAFEQTEARGIRGASIYDYLHLVEARNFKNAINR